MTAMIATDMGDDNLPRLIEQACAHAGMAAGDGEFEKKMYRSFCRDMSRLEDILRHKGLLPKPRVITDE